MRTLLIGLIFLAGMFNLGVGVSFLYDPVNMGLSLGVSSVGQLGAATVRGDFAAFFLTIGLCMLRGAWKRNGDVLLVPAALFGVAFLGRAITAATTGTGPGFAQPMVIEAVQFVLLVLGWRLVPHHKVSELTG